MKMTLENYVGLLDPREYIQVLWYIYIYNAHKNLELVIQDGDTIYKILFMIFKGLARAWYNNLKPGSIMSFNYPCAKLVSWFNTNILTKRSSIKLFDVNQSELNLIRNI